MEPLSGNLKTAILDLNSSNRMHLELVKKRILPAYFTNKFIFISL